MATVPTPFPRIPKTPGPKPQPLKKRMPVQGFPDPTGYIQPSGKTITPRKK